MTELTDCLATMAKAASDFLGALTPKQRAKANLTLEDEDERRRWYYTPNERAGLPLVEMSPRQQQLAMRLLCAGLSEAGYTAACTIIGLENVLDRLEGFSRGPYAGRAGETRRRDPGLYYVTVFGAPGAGDGWGWRFGGHHVGVHYVVREGFVSPTPTFFGAHPSVSPLPGGAVLRPLGAEDDLGRALVETLRPDELARAVISPVAPADLVQSNRPRVEDGALPIPVGVMMGMEAPNWDAALARLGITPDVEDRLRYTTKPKGLPAAALDAAQRKALARLIRLYVDRMPPPVAARHEALTSPAGLDGVHFAWAGSLDQHDAHYYRVQAERLLIECDTPLADTNHIHTVWRDPAGDFGGDILARHYAAAH
jgi:hypothetical protein